MATSGFWAGLINAAARRLAPKVIESPSRVELEVAEAAVLPVADEVKGQVPDVYVSLKPGYGASKELEQKVSESVSNIIGKIARPAHVYIVPDMPKTRSGKIMRRVLAAISNRGDVGDVTTLANPDIVEEVRKMVQQN